MLINLTWHTQSYHWKLCKGWITIQDFSNTCSIILNKHSPIIKSALHQWQQEMISWVGLFHLFMKSLVMFLNTLWIISNSLLNSNRIPTSMEVPLIFLRAIRRHTTITHWPIVAYLCMRSSLATLIRCRLGFGLPVPICFFIFRDCFPRFTKHSIILSTHDAYINTIERVV